MAQVGDGPVINPDGSGDDNQNQDPNQNPNQVPNQDPLPLNPFLPNTPIVPGAPLRPQLNWSHFKVNQTKMQKHINSGQMTGWILMSFRIKLRYKDFV